MAENPLIILGAGATKACGGPLTDDILPAALHGEMAHYDLTTLVEDREELLLDWHSTGFKAWLQEQKNNNYFPFSQD